MKVKEYFENVWAMTGGVTPSGYRDDFSILDHGTLDAPYYQPSGSTVGFDVADEEEPYRVTVPNLAWRQA